MRCRLNFYPRIRAAFKNSDELCAVINRSQSYVWNRINGSKEFTFHEKCMVAEHLGEPKERIPYLFMKEAS